MPTTRPTADPDPEELPERALLEVVRGLLEELDPRGRRTQGLTLDASLDRDLGLDSLTRMELLTRVARKLEVRLPDRALVEVETPRDLLRAVAEARAQPPDPTASLPGSAPATPRPLRTGEAGVGRRPDGEDCPRQATTLLEVLDWHAAYDPERPYLRLIDEDGSLHELTYAALRREAGRVARGLQARGLDGGRPVGMMLATSLEYFHAFFGILLAGGVPVPLYPPVRAGQLEDHLRRQRAILESAEARLLLAPPEAAGLAMALRAALPGVDEVLPVAALVADEEPEVLPVVRGEDLAFLQYTSGSTGAPKGVALTHANLLANIRAFCAAIEATREDVFVSWLPLYHDMGLIGACLGTLYSGVPLVLMSPLRFLADPVRWLRALDEHGGTLSAAPNFAFELCATRIPDSELQGLDLSRWRRVVNGAEPVSPVSMQRFLDRYRPYGFRPEVMAPCFGLAECSLALTFSPPGRAPVVDRIDRVRFTATGEALPVSADASGEGPTPLAFVGCGYVLPGHELRIVDELGRELGDRQEGRIEFRGPSATRGYHRNPAATAELCAGDWLRTGDLGYLAGGELHVTGRVKDVIIRAGRNIYPHELEEAAGAVEGVRKGRVAAFGARDRDDATERLVLAVETRLTGEEEREALRRRLQALSAELLGLPADEVVLLPPGSLLKTSSGKIRRAAVRALHEAGELERGPRSGLGQLLGLASSAFLPGLARGLRTLGATLWAAWFWVAFFLTGTPSWLACLVLPSARARWFAVRLGCRLFLLLTGIRVRREGTENLPLERPAVLVCNHSSYTDTVVLLASSPAPMAFVAKRELADHLVSRVLFGGLGALFVERFDRQQAVADAAAVKAVVASGRSVLFFPEGTFFHVSGLQPFHMGAFLAAAEAGLPVVPMALSGTRSLLRPDQWFPRRGEVTLTVGPACEPSGRDLAAAAELRDRARDFVLAHCGEPDLHAAGFRPVERRG